MGKSTEGSPGTIAGVLNVIAFSRFIDLRVKLLLSPAKKKQNKNRKINKNVILIEVKMNVGGGERGYLTS